MKKAFLLIAILALLLTACREKVDIYFDADEDWRTDLTLTIDQEILDFLAQFGGITLPEELGLPELPPEILDSDNWLGLTLEFLEAEWQKIGVEARWNQSGNTYSIHLAGESYDQMESAFFQAVTLLKVSDNPPTYQFSAILGIPADALALFTLGLVENESIVTVHAGRILDCNNCEINGNTATWRNPGNIQVTFTPASVFSWQLILLVLGAVVTIGLIIFIISRLTAKSHCPNCGQSVRKGQEICPYCGGYIVSYNMTDV